MDGHACIYLRASLRIPHIMPLFGRRRRRARRQRQIYTSTARTLTRIACVYVRIHICICLRTGGAHPTPIVAIRNNNGLYIR